MPISTSGKRRESSCHAPRKSSEGRSPLPAHGLHTRCTSGIFGTDRFKALAAKGARPQRLLWASTSTKNPAYSDVKYVEALIGEHTINTVPLETFDAYRDHGDPAPRLEQHVDQARMLLEALPEAGIDLDAVTRRLEEDGVRKFAEAYERLTKVLAERRTASLREAGAAGLAQRPG